MKKIHILPTDNKLSRLYFNVNDKKFQICEIEKPSTILKPNRHIYITSDEEIGTDEYYFHLKNNEYYNSGRIEEFDKDMKFWRKIILTTDQDLIKDGVQTIDNEFLEWFVKNPSCEEVEVQLEEIVVGSYDAKGLKKIYDDIYKILIPKGEPKQETTLEEAEKEFEKLLNGKGLPTKQLLEVAEHYFIVGYEIAKERSYSEEDLREAFIAGGNSQIEEDDAYGSEYIEYMEEWLEQFKKK